MKYQFLRNTKATNLPSILLLVCMVALPQISETIYSPSLPGISYGLSTSMRMTQWTLAIYFVGFALGVSVWGKISDHIGRRVTALIGISLYIVMSVLCATIVFNIYKLLALRFFQAFGISVGSVITQTIMRDCFSGVQRNKIFSIIGAAIGLAPAVGPILGGLLVEYYHWQSNFLLLTLLGILLLVYVYSRLPETKPLSPGIKKKVGYASLLVRMLADKHVIASAVLVGCFNGILFSYYAHAPFIFIEKLHLSPSSYGYLGIIMAVAVSLGSFLSGRISTRIQSINIVGFAVIINLVAMLFFSLLANLLSLNKPAQMLPLIMISMGIFYVSFGLAIPNILSNALLSYAENIGTAGSILGIFYYVVLSIVLFGVSFIIAHPIIGMSYYFLLISILMFAFYLALRSDKESGKKELV